MKILNSLFKLKLHQIILSFILVIFACTIRHFFYTNFRFIKQYFYRLYMCFFLDYYLFIDYLKDYLNELNTNLELGKIFRSAHYMGGGENNNTVSIINTEIKIIDKLYLSFINVN